MQPQRREFLKHVAWASAVSSGVLTAKSARASGHGHIPEDPMGVLVDMTVCVGCRLCEYACKQANGIEAGDIKSYDDQSVFKIQRRPHTNSFTVVNAWPDPQEASKKTYAKLNCMHCNYPACASACIVGALQKQENGAVTYDAWKCIGCRYCMVACPFQLPAYSYDDALTPQVRKCQFCFTKTEKGELPGCIQACPRQAMTYGKRNELLKIAHQRIADHPEKYIDHIYGEHEVGGTSWMYLSGVPFEQTGFLTLGEAPPPELTETIQHGVFKHWIAPLGWYGFLASMMFFTRRRDTANCHPECAHEGSRNHSDATLIPGSFLGVPAQDDSSHAAPVNHKLLTPGVWTLITLLLLGVICGLYRFIFGLAASTNLDQQHPWGLWIAMDVGSGIALAGGGFVTAALVHIFHREHYHAVARSALLTALLGYTFYVPGLLADIGRWYNIWHPTLPSMWQGNSVLFEVGICVMLYLNVQYAELLPIICERVMTLKRPRIARIAKFGHDWLEKIMPALLVLGVALSTFHQSSLGNLMVIAPYKLHRLWWTPVSPLLFLLSAMMVGFPMVIFTILFASWSLNRKPEMHVLGALARYIPIGLTLYLGVKIGDMIVRRTYVDLVHDPYHSVLWIGEMLIGVVVPLAMLLMPRVRQSARLLGVACLAVILGVVLNRLNCFVLAYHPPFATKAYFPSLIEFGVSIGLVAALMLTYRVAVTYLPILEPHIAPEENATQRPQRRRERREILACASLLCGLCVSAVSVLFLFSRTASADPTTQPATQPLGPKVVVLDELSALYKPVPFAHEEHAKMAQMWDGCKTCHHREPKVAKSIWLPPNIVPSQELTTVIPKCSSCHEPSVTAVDMHTPNLKGALHRQCLNCHREWMHENACVVCHEPRDPTTKLAATTKPSVDDIVGRIHPPIDPPDVKTYRPRFTPAVGVNIIFRHKEHTASYGLKCVSCHHRDNCAHCHDPAQNTSEQKILRPGRTWRASHEPCIGCHEKDRCKTCHYSDTEDPPSPGSRKANNRPATEPANVTAVAPTTKPTIVRIRSGGS